PDFPGGLVLDAELERPRLARRDHLGGLRDDLGLHASSRHRAEKRPLPVDHELAAGRLRRRTPRLDHGGERDLSALAEPVYRLCQYEVRRTHDPVSLLLTMAARRRDRLYRSLIVEEIHSFAD